MSGTATAAARTDAETLPPPRASVRLTPEGGLSLWFALLFAGGAWLLDDPLVLLLGCLLLGTALGAYLRARRGLAHVAVARRAPSRARVGVPTTLAYEVANHGRRAAVGLALEDRPDPSARPVSLRLELDGVPAGGSARVESDLTFGRRGRVTLAPVTLSTRYPLGLFRAARQAPAPATVLVRPREGRPTPLLRGRVAQASAEEAVRQLGRPGDDAPYGVREFREGDDPRRIHWRTTARRGVTTVTEWRAETGRHVLVVLGTLAGAGSAAGRVFERAVSCAATVWRLAHRERLPATLVLGGRGGTLRGGPRPRALDRGLDLLAAVPARSRRAPLPALEALAREAGTRCVVYVGTGPEPGVAARLAAAAGRGGQVVHLRADLPSVTRWVRGLP